MRFFSWQNMLEKKLPDVIWRCAIVNYISIWFFILWLILKSSQLKKGTSFFLKKITQYKIILYLDPLFTMKIDFCKLRDCPGFDVAVFV